MENAESLYLENERLVHGFLNQNFKNSAFDEDVQQVAKMGLWKACLAFDESRGVSLSTFAYSIMRNEVLVYFRAQKKSIKPTCSIYDVISEAENGDRLAVIDTIPSIDSAEDCIPSMAIEAALSGLSERHKTIVKMCVAGYKQREVAEAVGYNQVYVGRVYGRFKRKLNSYMRCI